MVDVDGEITLGATVGEVDGGEVDGGEVDGGEVDGGEVVGGVDSPTESSFTTNASVEPLDTKFAVPAPGSKSAVPEKRPATYAFPNESTATAYP